MAVMLEAEFDQAAGLSALQLLPPTRVLPLVQSPVANDSLELLYVLEQGLLSAGLPVWVRQGWTGQYAQASGCDAPQRLRHELAGAPAGTVVLWQAPLEVWAVLLAESAARPLVALTPDPASLLHAYNAVKVLWQVSSLMALVLSLPNTQTAQPGFDDASVAYKLQQQCLQRLRMRVQVWPLGYDHGGSFSRLAAEEPCVLKVLETALVLENFESRPHVYPNPTERRTFAAAQKRGVLDVHRQRYA